MIGQNRTAANWFQMAWDLYGKTVALMAAIAAGFLFPQAHSFSFLIQYFLFFMLFLAFLGIRIDRGAVRKSTFLILLANISIAFSAYFLLVRFDSTLALAAFMTGITPTAVSAPVFIGFLKRRVEYVVVVSLLTNITIALLIPVVLPVLVQGQIEISIREVLQSVLLVVLLPLALAHLVSYFPQRSRQTIHKAKFFSFYLWVGTLFLVVSKSSNFIFHNLSVSGWTVIQIALTSLCICVLNFSLGALIGGEELRREASQSLGQKNLSFTIWLALTFINPVVALGPTFYVIYHNLYNSFQLYLFAKEKVHERP